MELRWNLDELYTSFNSKEFQDDMHKCEEYLIKVDNFTLENLNKKDKTLKLEEYLTFYNEFYNLIFKLYSYSYLNFSVDTKCSDALKGIETIEDIMSKVAKPIAAMEKSIGDIEDLEGIINSSTLLKEHEFFLKEIKNKSRYILSKEEEAVVAKMKTTGSSAWEKLQELLTSNLMVDIEVSGKEEKLPLTVVRNMAFEADSEARIKAYKAEIAAYSKIEDSVAAALNGIKGEVITVADMRGYESPLEETLMRSRMDRESLEAMLGAMKESLPKFREYFKRKGELLGHKNGLPFYDLFAPMGKLNKKYTYEEAEDFVVENFNTFSKSLSEFAKGAFENNWIDAEPREGKVGGAYCMNLHCIGQSRIMSNFGGNFGDIITLAHELGHGYHGYCLNNESAINSEYPMPIAETASTFCETIVKKAAVKNASKEEAFAILENELQDCSQVIVDILSRYIFETEMFKRRKDGSVSVQELKEIMLKAQEEAYGDGLDKEYMHPYMWLCKSHYYSAEANFYNFPYAFGLLFAKGLYAEYLKRGSSFAEDYAKLLSITGKNNIADVTMTMGIDIHSVDFWRSSLKMVEEDIDTFIKLSK